MRTTTNGMPRYSRNGDFNNSFHVTRNGMNPERMREIIMEWSRLLNKYNVNFVSGSYNRVTPGAGDLMYLDPPYAHTKGMYYGAIDCEALYGLSTVNKNFHQISTKLPKFTHTLI